MPPRSGGYKFKVLLVDDEADIVEIMKKGLEVEDFLVDGYTNPELALSEFRPVHYDIALLDIRMPQLNGFELYKELKKKDNDLRVCFITAFEIYYDEFRRVFPTISVSCFIKKPVQLRELVKVLKEELETRDPT